MMKPFTISWRWFRGVVAPLCLAVLVVWASASEMSGVVFSSQWCFAGEFHWSMLGIYVSNGDSCFSGRQLQIVVPF